MTKRTILSILLLSLPVIACSTSADPPADAPPAKKSTDMPPAAGDDMTAGDDDTAAGDDSTGDDGADAAPPPKKDAGDPCACPSTCMSAAVKNKPVCHPHPAPKTLPDSQVIGSFVIEGYEYWQWKKPDPYAGGSEVAWGYNGDGEPANGVKPSAPSRACMAEARAALEHILKKDLPKELEQLRMAKGVQNFWNWNNDMTDAPKNVSVPEQYDGLWLYDGSRGDGGLIKWISATERDGSCRLPTRDDLVTFAKACINDFPDCGSGK